MDYWKPTVKQERFLSIPLTIKEAFYAGSVGAGKSDVLLFYPAVHGWIRNPNFKGLYLRRTMPELRNEIIPRSREIFRKLGGTFNKTDSVWEFPSGALYFFGHCEHEDDVHKYDSMQINYCAFDELTSFTEWQYLYITIERVRKSTLHGELPSIVRSGSNPGNIGHVWVRKRFIDPCKEGNKIIVGRGGVKRIFIPATIEDNPHIDPSYKASLDALPEAERKAKKFGDWSAYEGQVFDEFRDKKIPDEPENAIHVIEPFRIPLFWPKIVAIDWGFQALTYALFGAVSPNKKLIAYQERAFKQEKIEEWGAKLRPLIDQADPADIIICHSAGQNRGEPHTILEQVETALGRSLRLSEKDRIAGKMLLHEYFRWKPIDQFYDPNLKYDDEFASWILRNKGLEYYKSYLAQFNPPEPEMNLPKFQCFNCPILVDTIKACVYDPKNPEDILEFSGDDPYDTVRYLVSATDRFFSNASDAQVKLHQQQELIEHLERTHDMTSFYHRARIMESKETIVSRPISPKRRRGFYGSYSRRIH